MNVAAEPNSKNAVGRFYYRPSFSHQMYAGHSTIDYTFGDQAFGAKSVCRVFATKDGKPDLETPYMDVSECSLSGSKITLTVGKDMTSPGFHVQITSMAAWVGSSTNKVDGNLYSFKN